MSLEYVCYIEKDIYTYGFVSKVEPTMISTTHALRRAYLFTQKEMAEFDATLPSALQRHWFEV